MAGGSRSLIAIQLHRDGFNKPWGFRLQGGLEQGQPLTVQRVFMGSPSEGIIHRGDIVVRINDFDSSRMQLRDADHFINNSALTLRLEIQRVGGSSSHPTSPQPQQQQQQPPPAWANSPTLQLINQPSQGRRGEPRWNQEDISQAGPGIRSLVNQERNRKSGVLDYVAPLPNLDHLSVTNQTYRTNQLISPAPKAKHFRPMGSYLDASFGRQNLPQPKVAHDSQYSGGNTRSSSRGVARPASAYDLTGFNRQYSGSLSPHVNGSNGFSRQNSGGYSPSPRSPSVQTVLGGRQWPPPPQAESPPIQQPSNPFSFGGPQQSPSSYQQPQYQQQRPQYQQQHSYTQQQQPQYQPQYQQQQPAQLPFVIPETGSSRKIVHSQFNSPAGLYSTKNAVDMFTGQTGLRPNQVQNEANKLTDFKLSPTYKALMEAQTRGGVGTQWGNGYARPAFGQGSVSDL
ncbi:hypothetical protein BV898_16152 [Hypsibius exemplaris]|uniref:PDZ domain-containing protein n=1 Tax=Hypsibius exemplaris TaxID=2072580 RepID=A0A9X6RL12_HYPEX|nr:hypothetical protein BV898_16152 [Hypsibius exemplaris]